MDVSTHSQTKRRVAGRREYLGPPTEYPRSADSSPLFTIVATRGYPVEGLGMSRGGGQPSAFWVQLGTRPILDDGCWWTSQCIISMKNQAPWSIRGQTQGSMRDQTQGSIRDQTQDLIRDQALDLMKRQTQG